MCERSMVTGYLKSIGINVQQHRVTQSLARVDSTGSRIRWSLIIRRRKYHVPAANSLWHIDSHHSLIRWGFVIHGDIDGFSKIIVFLHCSANNKADSVSNLFEHALNYFGTPSRLRTDKGGGNVTIGERMTELRGENRGSYVADRQCSINGLSVCGEMYGIMFPTNFIMFSRQCKIKVYPNNNM